MEQTFYYWIKKWTYRCNHCPSPLKHKLDMVWDHPNYQPWTRKVKFFEGFLPLSHFCWRRKYETHKSNIIKHFHVLVKTTNHRLVQDSTWITLVLFMMHFLYTWVWISLLLKVYLLICWNLTKLSFKLVNGVWCIFFICFFIGNLSFFKKIIIIL